MRVAVIPSIDLVIAVDLAPGAGALDLLAKLVDTIAVAGTGVTLSGLVVTLLVTSRHKHTHYGCILCLGLHPFQMLGTWTWTRDRLCFIVWFRRLCMNNMKWYLDVCIYCISYLGWIHVRVVCLSQNYSYKDTSACNIVELQNVLTNEKHIPLHIAFYHKVWSVWKRIHFM